MLVETVSNVALLAHKCDSARVDASLPSRPDHEIAIR